MLKNPLPMQCGEKETSSSPLSRSLRRLLLLLGSFPLLFFAFPTTFLFLFSISLGLFRGLNPELLL
jgi:hypothetical protein